MISLRFYRNVSITGFALLVAAAFAVPAEAAAPRLIMVYGSSLSRPVLLTDWEENRRVLGVEEPRVAPDELAGQPYFELALFWGPGWDESVRDGKPLHVLRPEQANQHARLYPGIGDADGFIVFRSIPGPGSLVRRVTPEGAEILAQHGVAMRLVAGSSAPTTLPSRSPAAGAADAAAGSAGSSAPAAPSPSSWSADTWGRIGGGAVVLLLVGMAASAALMHRKRHAGR